LKSFISELKAFQRRLKAFHEELKVAQKRVKGSTGAGRFWAMTCLTRPINVTVYDLDGSETPEEKGPAAASPRLAAHQHGRAIESMSQVCSALQTKSVMVRTALRDLTHRSNGSGTPMRAAVD
jgi:hypothetical protein